MPTANACVCADKSTQRSIARSSQIYEAILRLSAHCFGFIAANFLVRLNLAAPVFQRYTTCPDAHNRQMK